MRKRSGQVHSRESSATLQLTVSLLYHNKKKMLTEQHLRSILQINALIVKIIRRR